MSKSKNKKKNKNKQQIKPAKQQLITREQYKRVKKMDRSEFEQFLSDFFDNAHTKGSDSMKNFVVDTDALKAELLKIKGMGEVKVNAVMQVILKMSGLDAYVKEGSCDDEEGSKGSETQNN